MNENDKEYWIVEMYNGYALAWENITVAGANIRPASLWNLSRFPTAVLLLKTFANVRGHSVSAYRLRHATTGNVIPGDLL